MSDSGDYVASFQDDLKATTDLLEKCASMESSLREAGQSAAAQKTLPQLASTLDGLVLTLSRGYLQSMAAQMDVRAAAHAAQAAEQECSVRRDLAADAGDDFEQLMNIYGSEIGVARGRSHDSENAAQFQQYMRFCRRLFSLRHDNAEAPVSLELCKMLYEDHVREQANDDDDLAVGTSVSRPVCPLSSEPLREPVRAPCGHYFSKENILAAIAANNNSCKCPSAGCRQIIQAKNLIRDPFKDLEVNQWLHEEERQRLEDTQLMTEV